MKKKLLITLATIIGGGIIAVVIAQTPEEMDKAFDLGAQSNIQGPDAFSSNDLPDRAFQAYQDAGGQLSRQEWNEDKGPGGGERFLTPEQQEVIRGRDAMQGK